jgi:hypothetical protein
MAQLYDKWEVCDEERPTDCANITWEVDGRGVHGLTRDFGDQ